MASETKDMWLKILIGALLTLILLSFGFTTTKVDKDTLKMHEMYQMEQFKDIKDSLKMILEKV